MRIYADEEEKKNMKKNNPALIRDLERFILELKSMKRENAFEVTCGECHVTRELF